MHAHAISQVLSTMLDSRISLRFWLAWQEIVWIFFWSLVADVLTWRFKAFLLANGILIVILSGVCLILFNWGGIWVPLIPPGLAIVITSGVGVVERLYFQISR